MSMKADLEEIFDLFEMGAEEQNANPEHPQSETAKVNRVMLQGKYVQNIPMTPFKIPKGSIVTLDESVAETTKHKQYEVLCDDGKYITLKAVEYNYAGVKEVDNKRNVKMPRKAIDRAYLAEEGKVSNNVTILPYGVRDEQINAASKLKEEYINYLRSMTEDEMKQFLALDLYMASDKQNQAIIEKDYKLAKEISNGPYQRSRSSLIWEEFRINHQAGIQCFATYLTEIESKNEVGVAIEQSLNQKRVLGMTTDEAFEVYLEMFLRVEEDNTRQMTLPELMLAYQLKGQQLRYGGTTNFFLLNKTPFHATKYDIANVENTIAQLT